MNNSNGGKFCTNLSVFFYLFPFFLVWLIYFKLWQKRNECISIEFFFCPFYFKSIKYVIICCFLCCSIEFRYVLLNEMMRMTGKIKLSTMKKKSTQDIPTGRGWCVIHIFRFILHDMWFSIVLFMDNGNNQIWFLFYIFFCKGKILSCQLL